MNKDITNSIIQIAKASKLDINIYSADGDLLYGCDNKQNNDIFCSDKLQFLKSKTKQKDEVTFFVLGLITDDEARLPELTTLLSAVAEDSDIIIPHSTNAVIYLKAVGKARDYRSAGEFAHTLYDNLSGETNISFGIGVGGIATSFEDIPSIIDHSVTAYKFGRLMDPDSYVYSYKQYAFGKLLDSLPQTLLADHLKMLAEPEAVALFGDVEMMRTADAFLKNSLNLSETARVLYLHRNTLVYRLDKIEDMTGLNIRYFSDAVIFRMMVTLSKLIKK
ncbi:MAG: helix-turn-helix domain-containing protein [Firmicutes bacterium]|nr:helix-turn-helix domain-containing protein [Bacillota bacterium]